MRRNACEKGRREEDEAEEAGEREEEEQEEGGGGRRREEGGGGREGFFFSGALAKAPTASNDEEEKQQKGKLACTGPSKTSLHGSGCAGRNPYRWQHRGKDHGDEVRPKGSNQVICQLHCSVAGR